MSSFFTDIVFFYLPLQHLVEIDNHNPFKNIKGI